MINRVFDNLIENAIRHSPAESQILIEGKRQGATRVVFSVENSIDTNSISGSLGMGTKIVEAILSLHQSSLKTDVSDGNQYMATFELSGIAHEVAQIHTVPQQWEDDAPPLKSNLPHVHAEEAQLVDEGNAAVPDELHVYAKEKAEGKGGLPSFNALGEATNEEPKDATPPKDKT
ncbi:histidine kinase [Enterovibrio coralii]|uniref:Histidine kinase/HSP90-like ATPase domain-containing protein n=1 Tax=Enterovibrio coralii TaxID=294935 RepID=A0A135IBX4_9GAMM|nr:sensor histidine kinase [Enterovibrio coralii]KXF82844.1 hypothetical protein ATN88_23545 [Enterovibrio coralii]